MRRLLPGLFLLLATAAAASEPQPPLTIILRPAPTLQLPDLQPKPVGVVPPKDLICRETPDIGSLVRTTCRCYSASQARADGAKAGDAFGLAELQNNRQYFAGSCDAKPKVATRK